MKSFSNNIYFFHNWPQEFLAGCHSMPSVSQLHPGLNSLLDIVLFVSCSSMVKSLIALHLLLNYKWRLHSIMQLASFFTSIFHGIDNWSARQLASFSST